MARSRLHRRYGRRSRGSDPAPRRNPPLLSDLADWIAPGFAGFAATRFLTYVAATQIAKRKPSLGKHAGALASVGSFAAAWYLADKVKFLAKYQMPLIVGSGLAAAQSLVQLYFPKLGWIVSDASPELAAASQNVQALPPGVTSRDQLQEIDDDPNSYVYNDSFDAGRVGATQQRADRQTAPTDTSSQTDEDLLAELDLEEQAGQANLGIFGGN